ncbi:hypothetical protein AJ88_15500 [Mesorhizobium amorphae CCBAU 01583]|nr:hypothetical protein AJ88_15500 [Mesorhizobium amorphae CCBAU 01583]
MAASVAGRCERRRIPGRTLAAGALSIETVKPMHPQYGGSPGGKPALGRHPTADAGDVGTRGSAERSLRMPVPIAQRQPPQGRSTRF